MIKHETLRLRHLFQLRYCFNCTIKKFTPKIHYYIHNQTFELLPHALGIQKNEPKSTLTQFEYNAALQYQARPLSPHFKYPERK